MRSMCVFMLALLALSGCQSTPPATDPIEQFLPKTNKKAKTAPNKSKTPRSTPAQSRPRLAPLHETFGKVASSNPALRFVVVDFLVSQLPSVDTRMSVYRQGQKVGELRITGPARDQNIAADIVAGEAQVGDEVRMN